MPEPEPEPPPLPPQPSADPGRAAPAPPPLVPADPAEVASALAYGLRFDEWGRPRKGAAWEIAAALLAEQLAAQLERSFLVCRRPPSPPHGT